MIIFRVGADDAKHLAQEVHPVFYEEDLINLPRYSMYLKLMIDGATSKPFSANTLPSKAQSKSYKKEVLENSKHIYGREIKKVQQEIREKHQKFAEEKFSVRSSLHSG